MAQKTGKSTYVFEKTPYIIGSGTAVGKKESRGPYGDCFDYVSDDEYFGEKSFERAESILQKTAVYYAVKKAGIDQKDIDVVSAGDLLNQCIGSSFATRDSSLPFVGLYGACSTMALSMIINSFFIESGGIDTAVSVASSHFCAAERQYRYPLEYGNQRTPTAQWTVTGAGAFVLSGKKAPNAPRIAAATIGIINDMGITDQNNMGAAMAPDDVKIRPYHRVPMLGI